MLMEDCIEKMHTYLFKLTSNYNKYDWLLIYLNVNFQLVWDSVIRYFI